MYLFSGALYIVQEFKKCAALLKALPADCVMCSVFQNALAYFAAACILWQSLCKMSVSHMSVSQMYLLAKYLWAKYLWAKYLWDKYLLTTCLSAKRLSV